MLEGTFMGNPDKKNIEESLNVLKAAAYDLIAARQQVENKLSETNQAIAEKTAELQALAQPKTSDPTEDAPTNPKG